MLQATNHVAEGGVLAVESGVVAGGDKPDGAATIGGQAAKSNGAWREVGAVIDPVLKKFAPNGVTGCSTPVQLVAATLDQAAFNLP